MSLRDRIGINAGDPTRPGLMEGIAVPAFYDDALCAQVDHDSFYPERGGSSRAVKKVCAVCPVREQCLEWALDNDEPFGIWGGFGPTERTKIKRERRAAA